MTKSTLFRARSQRLGLLAQLQFERFALAFKYDSDQPRDERGRWIETEDEADANEILSITPVARARDPRLEAECDEQLKRDIFQCAMVGLRSCYAQAHVRYAACLNGDPLPPLNY